MTGYRVLSFSKVVTIFELPGEIAFTGSVLLISNYAGDPWDGIRWIELGPYAASVYRHEC